MRCVLPAICAARERVSLNRMIDGSRQADSSEFITLHRFRFSAAKTTLVDKVRELLLHEFVDLTNRFLEAFLCCARNVEVQRRVLRIHHQSTASHKEVTDTYRRSGHSLVRVITSSGSDILRHK